MPHYVISVSYIERIKGVKTYETRKIQQKKVKTILAVYYKDEEDKRGRIRYNSHQMLKLILFCQMEKIQSLHDMAEASRNDIRIM